MFTSATNLKMEEQTKLITEAALKARVKFLLKVHLNSPLEEEKDSVPLVSKIHYNSEKILKQSGLQFCILRISPLYNQKFLKCPSNNKEEDQYFASISPSDVGLAAAKILLEPQLHSGKTYILTGPEFRTLDYNNNNMEDEKSKLSEADEVDFCPNQNACHVKSEDLKLLLGRDPELYETWKSLIK
jgi:uncharacterized protein YbjT (DUF2867 family)